MHDKHKPVLLDEIIKALNIQPDGFYIDGTFGRGGHSREIIKRLSSKGRLLAFDKDPDAVMSIGSDLIQDDRFEIIKGSFTMLMKCAKQYKVAGKISGASTLGTSSGDKISIGANNNIVIDGNTKLITISEDPSGGSQAIRVKLGYLGT